MSVNAEVRRGPEKLRRNLLMVLERTVNLENIKMAGICLALTWDVVAATVVAATMPVIVALLKMVRASVVNMGNGYVDQDARNTLIANDSQSIYKSQLHSWCPYHMVEFGSVNCCRL